MNELIKLNNTTIGEQEVNTVNARELHAFLEVGKDFSTWIKNRLETLGSVKNEDYVVVENLSSPNSGNAKARPQTLKEYYLTLDVAKHLAMMEKNEKGKQARQYFIECEKKLKETVPQVQVVGKAEDATRAALLLSQHLNIKGPALETFLVTTVERIIGVEIPYRPLIEQRTYSAKELGDVLGIEKTYTKT